MHGQQNIKCHRFVADSGMLRHVVKCVVPDVLKALQSLATSGTALAVTLYNIPEDFAAKYP